MKFLMFRQSSSQSVWSHMRCGGARSTDRAASSMVMGTWSEPGEGREVSAVFTKRRSRRLAKARSITEGRAFAVRGNLVYPPREFSRAKLPSAAYSK